MMSGETLVDQLTELLLTQLKEVAVDDDDLRRRESEVMKLSGTLSKFKRARQVRKLIENVRPFMESLPNFYDDFYYIMTAKICYLSYAPKFFDLVDVILSSGHVPAYIIAAYVKKLSRFLLTAPLHCQLPIITLIKNILYQHKTVHELLINRKEPVSLASDPFDENERNLAKCGAKESSLWELRSVQQHWFYRVADKANFVDRPAPDEDVPLAWQTVEDIFSSVSKKAALKLKRQIYCSNKNKKATQKSGDEENEENDDDEADDMLYGGSSDEEEREEHEDGVAAAKRSRFANDNSAKSIVEKPLINPAFKADDIFGTTAESSIWSL